ncbi:hypothetical protein H6F89_30425 [Cyanobacteria bacterium FACHB-63]|nr:hypothetical protein [Cyanobacteria bacterium FACHB-63]
MGLQEIAEFLQRKRFKDVEVFESEDQVLCEWSEGYWLNVAPADGWFRCILLEVWSADDIVDRLFTDLESAITTLAITAAVDCTIEAERVRLISRW